MDNLFLLLLLASLGFLIIGFFKPETSLFWDKKEPTKKKSAIVYAGLVLLFFILFGTTSDIKTDVKPTSNIPSLEKVNSSKTFEEKKDEMPIEQKLAILDANTFVDTTDIKVIRIKILLNDLAQKYSQSRDTIAEYTSRAQSVLHNKGIQESCLNILEDMHKAGEIDNTPYKDAITLYLMLRESQ